MLYVQLRRIERADGGTTIADFFARTFAFSDSVNPQTFVLDIRHDHGGDNTLLTPLIHGLIRREGGINTRGRLYTIIGRGTFSAAQNCANWIEEHTQTLFVGEPTGGKPNHYGDNQPVQLPRTHEAEVSALGYALLGEGRTAEAVAILGLNAEHYPGSANAWDSLAEATLAAGDRAAAERLYRKALAIDPGFRSSLRAL